MKTMRGMSLRLLVALAVVLLAAIVVYRYAVPSESEESAAGGPAASETTTETAEAVVIADEPSPQAAANDPAEVPIDWEEGSPEETATTERGYTEPAKQATESSAPSPTNGDDDAQAAAEPSPQAVIEADAEERLVALRNSCKTKLMGLGLSYLSAIGDEERGELVASGKAEVAACTSKFEAIVAETKQALEEGGFATDIIASYRETFEAEIAAGLAMAGGLRE